MIQERPSEFWKQNFDNAGGRSKLRVYDKSICGLFPPLYEASNNLLHFSLVNKLDASLMLSVLCASFQVEKLKHFVTCFSFLYLSSVKKEKDKQQHWKFEKLGRIATGMIHVAQFRLPWWTFLNLRHSLSLSFSNWCCCMCYCKSGRYRFLPPLTRRCTQPMLVSLCAEVCPNGSRLTVL